MAPSKQREGKREKDLPLQPFSLTLPIAKVTTGGNRTSVGCVGSPFPSPSATHHNWTSLRVGREEMAMAMAGGQKKSDAGRKKKGNEAVRSLVRIFLPIIKAPPPPPPLSAGSELCIGTEMEVRSRLLFTCQVISGSRRARGRRQEEDEQTLGSSVPKRRGVETRPGSFGDHSKSQLRSHTCDQMSGF